MHTLTTDTHALYTHTHTHTHNVHYTTYTVHAGFYNTRISADSLEEVTNEL